MTYRMLDSINVENLPPGADAYLGYVDGRWPTWLELKAKFPHAHLVSMAVFAADDAEGLDIESGDATVPEVYDWFTRQRRRRVWRPVLYISAASAASLLATMAANGFRRSSWRLLSAHYGAGEHICAPASCGYPQADGTQWSDSSPGLNGSVVDESLLAESFFRQPPKPKPKPPHPVPEEDNVPMLTNGTGQQTVIPFPPGSAKGIVLANDCTFASQPAPVVRLAAHSTSGRWQVHTITLTPSGTSEWTWAAKDADYVVAARMSGGAGDDVAVGYRLL